MSWKTVFSSISQESYASFDMDFIPGFRLCRGSVTFHIISTHIIPTHIISAHIIIWDEFIWIVTEPYVGTTLVILLKNFQ